jgi:hypothetical protein
MALLFTANLQPQGPSGLAAIRFNHPTRISTIRIFPHGVPIFESTQHIRSLTQPDAFYLDVFFNAQPLVPESKDRQHAVNALVPTSISYSGGLMDFAVDMGIEVLMSPSRCSCAHKFDAVCDASYDRQRLF